MYIDMLQKWNSRLNLTAVRQPAEIVTRHFGESLFVAQHLSPDGAANSKVLDVGSGAGFPGVPIAVWASGAHVTLIESNQKKATFLKELCRSLKLTKVDVFMGRAESFGEPADVVTLRAVESFAKVVPVAVRLTSPGGMLALLVGAGQVDSTIRLTRGFAWQTPIPIPGSLARTVLLGRKEPAM